MIIRATLTAILLPALATATVTAAAEDAGKPPVWEQIGFVNEKLRDAAPDGTASFDQQIDAMMNNNMTFLGLQTKVQSVGQTTQMMSNLAKTDSDAKLNAVRNLRN